MIVARDSQNNRLICITQLDHAELSYQFAAHWGNEKFSKPEPYQPMIIAAGEHDNGWWEYELNPVLDAEKRPLNFVKLPRALHTKFYRDGYYRVLNQDRYAGIMVVMHAIGLYNQRYGLDVSMPNLMNEPPLQNFLTEAESVRSENISKMRSTEGPHQKYAEDGRVWYNYKLLQVFDRISLHYCTKYPVSSGTITKVPVTIDQADNEIHISKVGSTNEFTLDPYPFDDSFTVSLRARLIPDKQYESNDELRSELDRSKRVMLEYKIRAPS